MLGRAFLICAVLGLAGCAAEREGEDAVSRGTTDPICGEVETGFCAFINSPVRVSGDPVQIPDREFQFFRTADELVFVDAEGRRWLAPVATLTDGASIPPMFVSVIGSPTSREFVNAAAVHDAFCGIGNEDGPKFQQATWEDVHRMFYEALIVGGTPPAKAGIMFSAVWLGGPRWDIEAKRDMTTIPDFAKRNSLRRTIRFIEDEEPNFEELHDYLWWEEKKMRKVFPPR